jgi:beta-lactam-binding protein with PASTA domain
MPSLVGLSYSAANARAASAGLHLVAVSEAALPTAAPAASAANPAPNGVPAAAPAAATGRSSGIVTAQSPQAGRRVVQGDVVHVTLGRSAPPAAAPVATQ